MNKFIFRKEYLEKLEGLDSITTTEILNDIIQYGLYQKEPESEGGILFLKFMRDVMDEDRRMLAGHE